MSSVASPVVALKNLSLSELCEHVKMLGEPTYRVSQLVKWVYQKRLDSFGGMANIPKKSRALFEQKFSLKKLTLAYCMESRRKDAVKFGFKTVNGDAVIESVLLYDRDRRTACVSSQLGCGLGCAFCATGAMGLIRNLSQEEIIGQLIGMSDYCAVKSDKDITNVVFMGMGEALSNFDAFMSSLKILMLEDAFFIGARRITVSTAGVIPSIERLMDQNLTIGLAISLNAFNNAQRDRIMPINKKYPIESLVAIARRYEGKTGRPVTFEYVVIAGENDTAEAVSALVNLLGGFPCKINVIPLNPGAQVSAAAPGEKRLQEFTAALVSRGLNAIVRTSRGRDISGACGQLSGKMHNELR
ncbi:MAG TPA: 23S rRNA (adenine(2503)-C(2))-methyltransferase RlmN [Chitinivibrionales bacterium]